LRTAAIRASAAWLVDRLQNRRVAAEFLPGGAAFDPEGSLELEIRSK